MASSSRNLDREVDETRERINSLAEGQQKLEDLLKLLTDSLKTTNGNGNDRVFLKNYFTYNNEG